MSGIELLDTAWLVGLTGWWGWSAWAASRRVSVPPPDSPVTAGTGPTLPASPPVPASDPPRDPAPVPVHRDPWAVTIRYVDGAGQVLGTDEIHARMRRPHQVFAWPAGEGLTTGIFAAAYQDASGWTYRLVEETHAAR